METKETKKPGMLEFISVNVDDEFRKWSFDDIEALRQQYCSEEADVPSLDDTVTEMTFCGVPMYVDSFGDIVRLFGIDK